MRCGWIRGRIAGGLCRRFRSGRFGCGHGMGWVFGLLVGLHISVGWGWGGGGGIIMDGAPWQACGFGRDLETVGRWVSDEYHGNHWGGCDGEIGGSGVFCVCGWVGVHIMRVVYRFAIDTPRFNSAKEQFAFAGSL